MTRLASAMVPFFLICAVFTLASAGEWRPFGPALEKRILESSQVLLVTTDKSAPAPSARVRAIVKRRGSWRSAFSPISAVIGRKGFAPPGEKREGDGRTPSGIFALRTTFGYDPFLRTRMPYRRATKEDVWVDDPDSDDYNRWVKRAETRSVSFEPLRREDDQYKYAIVVEYNTDPVIRGLGSAIFIHIWKKEGMPTAGCIALSEDRIIQLIRWLDPSAKPMAVMGTREMIDQF